MNKLKSGILGGIMAVSAHGMDAHAEEAEFQFPLKNGNHTVYIPVDCDSLDENGEITPKFVKQMGIWGHLSHVDYQLDLKERASGIKVTDEQRIDAYIQHLNAHGLKPEKINKAVDHCNKNYPGENLSND